MHKHALRLAVCFAALAAAGTARAEPIPTGVWIDHTGRGGVEITECGANLCGRIVWLKEGENKKGCGIQIIGNAKPVGKDTWDGGWIYDPEKNEKYSVELKPIGADKLRVLGYAGSKFFSETMIWKRAAVDLKRCDVTEPNVTASPTPTDKKADDPAPRAPAAKAEPRTPARDAGARPAGKEASQSDCKRYIPQIGETVSVPCEKKGP